jgi:hypothetical protein
MTMMRNCLLIATFGILWNGCSDRVELRRTEASAWRTLTLRQEGIGITVPKKSRVAHHQSFGVSVMLHPAVGPWFAFEDTQYHVQVEAKRIGRQFLDERKSEAENHALKSPEDRWRSWMADEHKTVDSVHTDEYSYYRYDVACHDDTVVQALAEVRHPVINGTPRFQEEDDRIVRAVLQSISCVGP